MPTPGKATCEEVAELLGLPLGRTVKCIMLHAEGRVWMLLIRGDHSLNEIKVGKVPGLAGFRWASDAEIRAATGCAPGYLGPVGIPPDMPLLADRTVALMSDFVCGANEADYHLRGVNFGRDCREPDQVADLRNVVAGDPSPDGKGVLEIVRGIEVGHVFALGTRYSAGDGLQLFWTPTVDRRSWRWVATASASPASSPPRSSRTTTSAASSGPRPMAPFAVVIAPVGYERSAAVRATADRLHDELESAGVEVLLDDRGERPGVMFADLELIGIPHRVTVGERGLNKGEVEYQDGARRRRPRVPAADAAVFVSAPSCNGAPAIMTACTAPRLSLSRRARPLRARARLRAFAATVAHAGAQVEEALAASVQNSLHRSVSDYPAPHLEFATDVEGWAWLADMSSRLAPKMPDWPTRRDFLITVQYEASRAGLDPQLVLGIIQHESNFRKYAVSSAGARGYMQVMPFWVHLIGDAQHGPIHPAHEPALRLHDPALLPRSRERRPVSARSGATTAASGAPNIRLRCSPRCGAGCGIHSRRVDGTQAPARVGANTTR